MLLCGKLYTYVHCTLLIFLEWEEVIEVIESIVIPFRLFLIVQLENLVHEDFFFSTLVVSLINEGTV